MSVCRAVPSTVRSRHRFLYERLVMAAIAASKTEEDLGRIFSFSWDTVRYLTNMNLSNDDFAKLTLAIFDRRPIPLPVHPAKDRGLV